MAGTSYSPAILHLPPHRTWTFEEFERATSMGVFGPDERLELLEGEIIAKMSQNAPHSASLFKTHKRLDRIFAEHFMVRNQMPLMLGERNKPEPDVAVVAGSVDDFLTLHPTSAVLTVEISDTTLTTDRDVKAQIYARAGIPEYWIVNLVDRLIEVHRQPAAMAEQALGFHYRSIQRLTESESVAPLAAPNHMIQVSELLP